MISTKNDVDWLKNQVECGSFKALARALTLVENEISPSVELLKKLKFDRSIPVVGITGPPGAGKSTLVNGIAEEFSKAGKKVAILAVDPTSPFNYGSLLGDRIRMSKHFNNPNIYIRSVATRGSLGGISAKTIEMVDVLRSSDFDLIMVETVGVGQSEIEIVGLADKTILVLVPEAGDEIQHIKSGLMEVAQAFVVNKADRDGADAFANSLQKMVKEQHQESPVIKTIADKNIGVPDVCNWITTSKPSSNEKKDYLLAEQAYKLIQHKKMIGIDRQKLLKQIQIELRGESFNLYTFVEQWLQE